MLSLCFSCRHLQLPHSPCHEASQHERTLHQAAPIQVPLWLCHHDDILQTCPPSAAAGAPLHQPGRCRIGRDEAGCEA